MRTKYKLSYMLLIIMVLNIQKKKFMKISLASSIFIIFLRLCQEFKIQAILQAGLIFWRNANNTVDKMFVSLLLSLYPSSKRNQIFFPAKNDCNEVKQIQGDGIHVRKVNECKQTIKNVVTSYRSCGGGMHLPKNHHYQITEIYKLYIYKKNAALCYMHYVHMYIPRYCI